MRTISKPFASLAACLAVSVCITSQAHAQQGGPPPVGFVRLVNAVAAGEGNTMMRVDGEKKKKPFNEPCINFELT